jgi:histidinol phosphatase-like PHP family hydrolase
LAIRVNVRHLWTTEETMDESEANRTEQVPQHSELGIPLVDLHAHLEGQVSIERALEIAQARGVRLGVVEHGGRGEALYDDETLLRYVEEMAPYPVYVGIQAEGLEWDRCFSEPARAALDYVLSDALTFPERDGRRVRLWTAEAQIDDAQGFMDRYVAFNVQVIASTPIDILANPTFLPAVIVQAYDALWTEGRMDAVIAAAVAHGVAIEINARYEIPSAAFIRRAKAAGVRFSFGSNQHGEEIGKLDYCVRMARECGLTRADIYLPGD